MKNKTKSFKIKKTFGIDVLLKLITVNMDNHKISKNRGRYIFNGNKKELRNVISNAVQNYNITLTS